MTQALFKLNHKLWCLLVALEKTESLLDFQKAIRIYEHYISQFDALISIDSNTNHANEIIDKLISAHKKIKNAFQIEIEKERKQRDLLRTIQNAYYSVLDSLNKESISLNRQAEKSQYRYIGAAKTNSTLHTRLKKCVEVYFSSPYDEQKRAAFIKDVNKNIAEARPVLRVNRDRWANFWRHAIDAAIFILSFGLIHRVRGRRFFPIPPSTSERILRQIERLNGRINGLDLSLKKQIKPDMISLYDSDGEEYDCLADIADDYIEKEFQAINLMASENGDSISSMSLYDSDIDSNCFDTCDSGGGSDESRDVAVSSGAGFFKGKSLPRECEKILSPAFSITKE